MEVMTVNYSPDGKRIVSVSRDGTARLWDAQQIERDGVLRGHGKFVYSAAFHPDGKRVVSASGTLLRDGNCSRSTTGKRPLSHPWPFIPKENSWHREQSTPFFFGTWIPAAKSIAGTLRRTSGVTPVWLSVPMGTCLPRAAWKMQFTSGM
jgi:WD40 repeat protein